MFTRTLTVGTRGSALAMTQTESVVAALQAHHPALAVRVQRITTKVPLRLDRPGGVHGIHVSAGSTEFSCSGEIATLNTGDTLLCDRSTADAVEIRPFSIAEIIVIDLQQLAR